MLSDAQILVVDNDVACQLQLQHWLAQAGYRVQGVRTGPAALDFCAHHPVDLVLLEVGLPDMDGLTVCAALRQHSTVPILMLSEVTGREMRLQALTLGADGYLTKPVHEREVVVRIQTLLRRSAGYPRAAPLCAVPELLLNETTPAVWVRGERVALTPLEYQVLRYLMHRPNCPISKGELGQAVWGYMLLSDPNPVETVIHRLRKKIEAEPAHPRYVRTLRGVGYQFRWPPPAAPTA